MEESWPSRELVERLAKEHGNAREIARARRQRRTSIAALLLIAALCSAWGLARCLWSGRGAADMGTDTAIDLLRTGDPLDAERAAIEQIRRKFGTAVELLRRIGDDPVHGAHDHARNALQSMTEAFR